MTNTTKLTLSVVALFLSLSALFFEGIFHFTPRGKSVAAAPAPADAGFHILSYNRGEIVVLHSGVKLTAACDPGGVHPSVDECGEVASQVGKSFPETPQQGSGAETSMHQIGDNLFYETEAGYFGHSELRFRVLTAAAQ